MDRVDRSSSRRCGEVVREKAPIGKHADRAGQCQVGCIGRIVGDRKPKDHRDRIDDRSITADRHENVIVQVVGRNYAESEWRIAAKFDG